MRTFLRLFACLSALLFLLPAGCKKDLSGAVAVVEGEVISKVRFDVAMESFARRLGAPDASMLNTPDIRQQVLDNLVGVELLFQAAKKAGYAASSEGVEREFKRFRENFATDEELKKALEERKLTEAMIREDIARQMVLEAYAAKGLGVPDPTEAEIAACYEENVPEVRASHILIPVSETADEKEKRTALAKAEKVRARLLKGEDFAKVAMEVSSDKGSAARGGDLGSFPRAKMVESFADAAFTQAVDEVGKPVLSPFGYHIIKVTEKPAPKPMTEVRESIVDFLKSKPVQEALAKKVEELKKTADIQILMAEPAPAPAGTAGTP